MRNREEIGIIGVNPQSNDPLNFGVTVSLSKESIKNNMIMGLSVTVEGKRQFEIEDKSFMDPSGSFYMANVEIVDDREENMSHEQMKAAERLSSKIPSLVKKWKELVLAKGMRKELNGLMEVRIKVQDFYLCCYSISNNLKFHRFKECWSNAILHEKSSIMGWYFGKSITRSESMS